MQNMVPILDYICHALSCFRNGMGVCVNCRSHTVQSLSLAKPSKAMHRFLYDP